MTNDKEGLTTVANKDGTHVVTTQYKMEDGKYKLDGKNKIKDFTEETNYKLPPLEYLKFEAPKNDNIDESYLLKNAKLIVECLSDFKINNTKVKEVFQGPTLTTYELEIPRGIQISKVIKKMS